MNIITNIPPSEAADIALKNRLYVSGWCLSQDLKDIRAGNIKNAKVVLAEKGGKYVSVAIHGEIGYHYNTAAFVRKSERRKGIASKMVGKFSNLPCYAGYGVTGSEKFWNKSNIDWNY